MRFCNKKPTAQQPIPTAPAARWVFACIAAAAAGVGLAYCWRVFYYLDGRFSPLWVTLGCVAGAEAAVGCAALVRYACHGFVAKATLALALCGVLFVFANPPMQAPDESQYFLRAYSISRGHLDFDAERAYPDDVAALYHALPGAWVNAHTSQGMHKNAAGEQQAYSTAGYALKQYGEDGRVESVLDSFSAYFTRADTTTVKEPVNFLVLPFVPQALGMAVARLLGLAALGCLYAGRLANLAVYILLCRLALRKAESARPMLLCVMLLPTSLFMAASLSYDAYLLGCYYLMAALLTRRRWDAKTMALYAAACIAANVAKPYLNLLWAVLPLLALAKGQYAGKGKPWQWAAGMVAGCLGASLLVEWYGTAFRYHYDVIARMGGEDVNQLAQLGFVLDNPLRFIAVLLGTLYENEFFIGQLGLFGWKDLPIPLLNITGPALLLAGVFLGAGRAPGNTAPALPLETRRGHLGGAAFCLLYGVGAMAAMYITYTPVSMVRVVGLQARYFLPVWAVMGLLLAGLLGRKAPPALSAERAETLGLRLFAPYAALGAVLLFQHYFIGPIYTI